MGTTKKQPQLIKMEDLVVGKTYRHGVLSEMLMTYLGSKKGHENVAFFKIPNNIGGFIHNEKDEEDVYGFWNGGDGFTLIDDEDEPQPTKEEQTVYDGVVTEHTEESLEVIKNGFPFELGKNYNYGRQFAGKFVGYDKVGDPLFENKKNKEKWGVVGKDRLVTLFNEDKFTLIEDND